MLKRSVILVLLLALTLSSLFAGTYTPSADNTSTYRPTQIINGDLATKPWINCYFTTSPGTVYHSYAEAKDIITSQQTNVSKIYNGVDGGWNTTEIKTWDGNFFEWSNGSGGHGNFSGYYLDMNVHDAAVLWQDLTTCGGDVIRWTLDHGASNASSDSVQTMRVEVGAPLRNSDNSLVPASGYGTTNKNNLPDSQTISATNATYKYNGITNGSGTVGFANDSELTNLSVSKGNSKWHSVKGVYVVPDGQTVTRFAFISEAPNPSCGNELANVTFSTLIGNLSAEQNKNRDIIIKGYWGDSDSSKKLMIKFDTEDSATEVDMSGVLNKNFIITIPKEDVPDDAVSIEVYHQEYVSAKRTIAIEHPPYILMYVGAENCYGEPGSSDLTPPMRIIADYYESKEVDARVDFTTNLDLLLSDTLINDYKLVIVAFPDGNREAKTGMEAKLSQYAEKLNKYAEDGGCLVLFGETNNQTGWREGNKILTDLAREMGLKMEFSQTDAPGSGNGNQFLSIASGTINANASLIKYDSNNLVTKLRVFYVPSIILGTGASTQKNTEIVASFGGEPIMTDSKTANGYVTLIGDINMWMTDDWGHNTVIEGGDNKVKQFMKNLLTRSADNIQLIASMNKIRYKGLTGSHYQLDSDGIELSNPTVYDENTETFTLLNPLRTGYEFMGWSGTGISGLSKKVIVAKGGTGDLEFTANWHKHEFKYVSNGSQLRAYCIADDKYASLCSYHSEENAITVFSAARASANLADFVYPVNATNKDLRYVSSNPEYVVVEDGMVRGIKKTTEPVKLTAYATDGTPNYFEIYVKVVE